MPLHISGLTGGSGVERLSDYDYSLPEELIAQTPLEDRAASRLLHLSKGGDVEHRQFIEVIDLLEPGDLLVMNDTRVSAVRLFGAKSSGGAIEALLLKELAPGRFEALAKPGKRLKVGATVIFGTNLVAHVVEELDEGRKVFQFELVPDLMEQLDQIGLTPLPPYIHKSLDNKERYQTVYSKANGSAAAPTAGLHFTDEILRQLADRRIEIGKVTLHVGLDTFRPVQAEDLSEHKMHGETCILPAETAQKIAYASGRIIAVGTTTVRTLESFAVGKRKVDIGSKESKLFIRPGYEFQVIDGMFTNFHLPKTTMLMMISALAGKENIFRAYGEAIQNRYRFLSFGDSMLIL